MAVISWLVLKANLTYLRWIKARLIKRSVGTYCSVSKLCLTLCDPMNCSMPGFPVLHYLLEFAQTHVHGFSDAIQPSHPLSPPSQSFPSNQHQGLFQWVGSHCGMELLQSPQSHSIPMAQNNNPGPGEGGGRENIQTLQKSNTAASWSASASRRVSPSKKKQLEKFCCPCHPQHKCTGNLPLR